MTCRLPKYLKKTSQYFYTHFNQYLILSLFVGSNENNQILSKQEDSVVEDTVNLPLVIRERDVRYQFKRTVLYRRLLQGYPYTRPYIWKEARIDSLPLYRSYIWAALLGIFI